MRTAFLVFFLPLALSAAEPSAFGAGNLDSDNPYGLTSSEKNILKNKQVLDDVKKKSRTTQEQVDILLERMDGLQSIVEGLSEKSHTSKNELRLLNDTYESAQTQQGERVRQLEEMVKTNAAVIKANEANILQLKALLDDFSKMIDTVNSNYVSKDDYNALVKDVNEFKHLVGKELKSIANSSGGGKLDAMSNGEIATKAKKHYENKQYDEAADYYEHLVKKKYKPAYGNYMLGEIWYYRKDYGKAIAYFKESAKLYDKASYMPVLMLHTAVSMQATGDIDNARAFYNAIIAKYPESKHSADAQARLDKLR